VQHNIFAPTLASDLDFQSSASCGHDPYTCKNQGQRSLRSKDGVATNRRTDGHDWSHYISLWRGQYCSQIQQVVRSIGVIPCHRWVHWSGPCNATSRRCVFVCVCTTTVERNRLRPRYAARYFILTSIIGHCRRSRS